MDRIFTDESIASTGNFDFLNFKIGAQFPSNISDREDKDKNLATLIHEYVHYLQGVTTIWGINWYFDLFALHKFFLFQLALHCKDISIPLKNVENEKLQELFFLYGQLKEKLYFHNYTIDFLNTPINNTKKRYLEIVDVLKADKYHLTFLADQDKKCWVPLSPSTLRENMALMATYYSRGIGQDAIFYSINDFAPKYTILFKYFTEKYPQIQDIRLFVFYACELALMDRNPVVAIDRLLRQTDEIISNEGYTFDGVPQFFNRLYNKYNYSKTISDSLLRARKEIEKRIDWCIEYKHENSYWEFLETIYSVFYSAVNFRTNNVSIFSPYKFNFDGNWIDHMADLFKSPIIFYDDGTTACFGKTESDFELAIRYVFGLAITLEEVSNNDMLTCPFYRKYSLCSLEKREEICGCNPLKVTPRQDGSGCLLYNSLALLRIKNHKYDKILMDIDSK